MRAATLVKPGERTTTQPSLHRVAELSRQHEDEMVLSVYLARESADPGERGAWRLRLDAGLAAIRSCLEVEARSELPAFERAIEHLRVALDPVGRVLPGEGWAGFATEEGTLLTEPLSFAPLEVVRWRQGLYVSPYLRALKSRRSVIVGVVTRLHAALYEYLDGELGVGMELHAESPGAEATDVGMSKRATVASGMRGVTRTDFVQRTLEENAKRLRKEVVETLRDMAGEEGGVALGGTPRATSAVRAGLEGRLDGRIVDMPEVSFDSTRAELIEAVARAASELTRARQSRLLDACAAAGDRASRGWNQTYRALAAGAVDTLLLSRELIEASPDDVERLVRLALAQGAGVEELGESLSARLMTEADGVAARLRFRSLG